MIIVYTQVQQKQQHNHRLPLMYFHHNPRLKHFLHPQCRSHCRHRHHHRRRRRHRHRQQ